MGTRANIGQQNETGSFDLIYTHWDGYPEHHAPLLLNNYNSNEKVAELLALGDLSILDENVGKRHSFDNPTDGWCVAYGRDRGEQGTEAKHFADYSKLKGYLSQAWTEWVYIWDIAQQAWFYTNNPSPTWFKTCGSAQLPLRPLESWLDETTGQGS
jgi:hypothetical protein